MQRTNRASVCLLMYVRMYVCLHVHLAIAKGVSVQREHILWSRCGLIPIPPGTRLEGGGGGGSGRSLLLDGCSRRSLVRMPLGARLIDKGGQISATYSRKSQQPGVYVKRCVVMTVKAKNASFQQ